MPAKEDVGVLWEKLKKEIGEFKGRLPHEVQTHVDTITSISDPTTTDGKGRLGHAFIELFSQLGLKAQYEEYLNPEKEKELAKLFKFKKQENKPKKINLHHDEEVLSHKNAAYHYADLAREAAAFMKRATKITDKAPSHAATIFKSIIGVVVLAALGYVGYNFGLGQKH